MLRLSERRVSTVHASLTWRGGGWWIRDLGSRNGTRVAERNVSPTSPVRLTRGDGVTFAGGRPWVLVDDEEPGPVALDAADRLVAALGGALALPDWASPSVVLEQDTDGGWWLDADGRSESVENDLEIDGWRVRFPSRASSANEGTTWTVAAPTTGLALAFEVSRDEEHLQVHVRCEGEWHALSPRVHQLAMLELARARVVDAAVDPAECGWIYADQLCRRVALTSPRLSLHLVRARQQLEDVGFTGPLIERRRLSGQIRLAVADVVVHPAGRFQPPS